jgi:REP element-mobilizing transposase RayT
MRLNECGELIEACWNEIPNHFPHVQLDAFVIMPNHVHGILHIMEPHSAATVGARHAVPLPGNVPHRHNERFGKPVVGSIPTIVRSVKSAASRRINQLRDTPGTRVWQRSYYEHIIRNEASLDRIRQYILDNPARWASDPENPQAAAPEPVEAWRT